MKDIKGDLSKWGDTPCSWMGRTQHYKGVIFPKVTCKFNVISIKISKVFFNGIWQADSQIKLEEKYTENTQE